jgi:hypothetical protein
MKRIILITCFFLFITGLFQVVAQEQEVDCTTILVDYREFKTTNPDNLADMAILQEWRRMLEAADPLPCDEDAFKALVKAINLTGDSILSNLLDKSEDAVNFQADASTQEAIAAQTLIEPPDIVDGAMITSPTDGQTGVDFTVIVEGTYPATQYDFTTPDQLWLFVVPASSQRRYPQIVEGCDAAARSPIVYENGNFSTTVLLGTEDLGRGEPFTIILMSADSAATEALYAKFDEWCAAQDYPGLSAREVAGIAGLEQLYSVTVTRAP